MTKNPREVKEVPVAPHAVAVGDDQDALQAPELDKVENAQDGFTYYLVRKENVDKYVSPRRIGAEAIGYRTRPAWDVVSEDDAERIGRGRADQGEALDSAVARGQMILLRMKTEDFDNSVTWMRRQMSAARERALYDAPETKSFDGGNVVVQQRVRRGHQAQSDAKSSLPVFQGR